ncbi:MAG: LysR family transcriptional regulator [Archangium sp.]
MERRADMDLNALNDFILVATHGGFAPASRAGGVPKSSLSRRVRELEEGLGVRLLDRTARTFRLTDEGAEVFHTAEPTLAGIGELEQTLLSKRRGEPSGSLRIAAPTLFGNFYLGRLAAQFHAKFPKVELEIVVADRRFDLLGEGFDAAICVNAPDTTEFVMRKLADCRMQLVAAPKFVAAFGALTPKRCRALPMALFTNAPAAVPWVFANGRKALEVIPQATMRLSTLAMVRDAVLEGAGFGMLPDTLIQADLSRGRLVHFGDLISAKVVLSVVHPSRRLVSARLRAFLELLVATFPGGTKPARQLAD